MPEKRDGIINHITWSKEIVKEGRLKRGRGVSRELP